MKHCLGVFFKLVATILILVFMVTLEYLYFVKITPAGMPWFPFAGMGLTSFGLICWLFAFLLERHHPEIKTIMLLMIVACLVASISTAAVELAALLHMEVIITQYIYWLLIVMLCLHAVALISIPFVNYFTVHPFDETPRVFASANLIRISESNANLIRIPERAGEPDSPLVKEPREEMRLPQLATKARVVGNSLMSKGKGFMKRGSKGGRVPGNAKTNISGDTSGSGIQTQNALQEWREMYEHSAEKQYMSLDEFITHYQEQEG